jgi:hypothetical protein
VARGLTLDTGALIAAERRSDVFRAVWQEAVRRHAAITIPVPVFAQAWRGHNPLIDRLLPACVLEPMTEPMARSIMAASWRQLDAATSSTRWSSSAPPPAGTPLSPPIPMTSAF